MAAMRVCPLILTLGSVSAHDSFQTFHIPISQFLHMFLDLMQKLDSQDQNYSAHQQDLGGNHRGCSGGTLAQVL